jgi:hypothetical protein
LEVLACELTEQGWRGLTDDGELWNVAGPLREIVKDDSGHQLTVPKPSQGRIDAYLHHFNAAMAHCRATHFNAALDEIEAAIDAIDTLRARLNRAIILLSLGHWRAGFAEYAASERSIYTRPMSEQAQRHGLREWRGENISGKRLLLIHDHGFGDSIMALRFVPLLQRMGIHASMLMPPELRSLAGQCGEVVDTFEGAEFFCSMLLLLHALGIEPPAMAHAPYLRAQPRAGIKNGKRTVGIAWSVGVPNDQDYPRQIPLPMLVEHFGADVELVSVQQQDAETAHAFGIRTLPFADFAECADVMLALDTIVSIDTAALHLAGAIDHPHVIGLLSYWHSWRWQAPIYANMRLCCQRAPDDWASALQQIVGIV